MSTSRDVKVAERRRDVAQMYLAGYKQAEIAVKHKVSQQMISLDIKHLHAEWVAAARSDFDEVKARELARIDRLEREYWQAWERSQQPQTKAVKEESSVKLGNASVPQVTTRVEKTERVGDAKYLDGIKWCIEQRLKIFGVYEADKQNAQYLKWLEEHGYTESEAVAQFRAAMGNQAAHGEGYIGTASTPPAPAKRTGDVDAAD